MIDHLRNHIHGFDVLGPREHRTQEACKSPAAIGYPRREMGGSDGAKLWARAGFQGWFRVGASYAPFTPPSLIFSLL